MYKKRPLFAQNSETQKLVAILSEMSIGEVLSFADLTKRAGFAVSSGMPSYQSARRILVRDYRIITEGVRGVGVQRLDGSGMVQRGGRLMRGIRRRAKRGAQEMDVALMQNLNRNDQLVAANQLTRFRLMTDVARHQNIVSNKEIVEEPQLVSSYRDRPKSTKKPT